MSIVVTLAKIGLVVCVPVAGVVAVKQSPPVRHAIAKRLRQASKRIDPIKVRRAPPPSMPRRARPTDFFSRSPRGAAIERNPPRIKEPT